MQRNTLVHRHYYEIEGNDAVECGQALGRLFGPLIRSYLAAVRPGEAWRKRKRRADVLLSATLRYFPTYIQELQAYADAAHLDLLDLWTTSIEDELITTHGRCSTCVTNGGRLIAHNEDWDPTSSEDICVLKKRCGDTTTLELYYYGAPLGGTALSICSHGYVQAINSLNHTDRQAGVPRTAIARRLSEIRSLNEAERCLATVPRASGFAHNLVSAEGRLASIESTAGRHIVHHPKMPFVHTNHMTRPELATLERLPTGSSTFRRYEVGSALLRKKMGRSGIIQLMSDQTKGDIESIFNQNTIARGIVDLDQRIASFWLRREYQKGWVEYPIDFLVKGSAQA